MTKKASNYAIYQRVMYDDCWHWPIYNPSYLEETTTAVKEGDATIPPKIPSTLRTDATSPSLSMSGGSQRAIKSLPPRSRHSFALSLPRLQTWFQWSVRKKPQDGSESKVDSLEVSKSRSAGEERKGKERALEQMEEQFEIMVSMEDASTSPALIHGTPREKSRQKGKGGEWRIGDFGYCTDGTFLFSRNLDDILGHKTLEPQKRQIVCNAPGRIVKGNCQKIGSGVDVNPPILLPSTPGFEFYYTSQSQEAALLATTSNALRFSVQVTQEHAALEYFKQYFKTVMDEDIRGNYFLKNKREICMITGLVKSFDWLVAVSGSSQSCFGVKVEAQPVGLWGSLDKIVILGSNPVKGPDHEPREGYLVKEGYLGVGDQTLFISRIMCKHRGIPAFGLLKGGGSRPPSPSTGPADKSLDPMLSTEIICDSLNEDGVYDPLRVLLEAMLILHDTASCAIASDIDLSTLCQKSRWKLEWNEWTTQKAVELLQACGDCIKEDEVGLTLTFSNDFTRSTEDEHTITLAPEQELIPIGVRQSLEGQELMAPGVRLQVTKVYEQDLDIIGYTTDFAIGFSLSLDFAGSERLNITKLHFKVEFLDNAAPSTLMRSTFPRRKRGIGWPLYHPNPVDATIAYPMGFEDRFGIYRKEWSSLVSFGNKAAWYLTGEHLTAPSCFSLVVEGNRNDRPDINVEARAFSSTGGMLSSFFGGNKLAAGGTWTFSSYPCWSEDWSRPDEKSSWLTTQDVASHWV
ncbi:hypothetical protein BT69DRAFT_1351345 [Atractiella rhizophila]|nr:hypothetical protein BT69DRAFT_1351345 [Atractiella rhizophila]